MPSLFVPDDVIKAPVVSFTFTGAAGLGAVGQTNPIWTPTGRVELLNGVWAYVTAPLVGGAGSSVALGFAGNPSMLLGATAFGLLLAGIWWDTTVAVLRDASGAISKGHNPPTAISSPVTMNIAGNPITGGSIEFYAYYRPLTPGASLA